MNIDTQRERPEKKELVIFETADSEVKLPVIVDKDTVWLNRNQMAELFGRDRSTIFRHINNAIQEELAGEVVVANFATTTQHGAMEGKTQTHMTEYYNLDVIISVGYRVKSKRGVEFRKWANRVLKKYILDGYALNEKRLQTLQKTVQIQSRMLADTMGIDHEDVLWAVSQYEGALNLLDDYDHQSLVKPDGNRPIYRITYDECAGLVNRMKERFATDVFGVEREEGKVEGILAAVYQSVFGQDVYPSLEEKAANLLYFMVKDHPYADGCKRIASSIFLVFLDKNHALYRHGQKVISDGELVAITLMIAESDPKEKEIMTTMVMNFLTMDPGGNNHNQIPAGHDNIIREGVGKNVSCQDKIRELRAITGMSRKDFCAAFHIPYQTVTDWELNKRTAPDYVMRLLEYYIRMERMMS